MSPDLLMQIGGFAITAAAIYGGIRSDLRAMHERIEINEKAIDRLHVRLDGCVACKGRRGDA